MHIIEEEVIAPKETKLFFNEGGRTLLDEIPEDLLAISVIENDSFYCGGKSFEKLGKSFTKADDCKALQTKTPERGLRK